MYNEGFVYLDVMPICNMIAIDEILGAYTVVFYLSIQGLKSKIQNGIALTAGQN